MEMKKMKNGLLALTLAAACSFETVEAADIQTVDGRTPEAEIGEKKLAERRKQKQTQVWLYHPAAVNEYRVYLFYSSPEVESLLKNIAEIHWKVNDLNDQYVRAKSVADMAIRQGDPDRANQALKLAKIILQKSQEARNRSNKIFEELLARRNSVFYNTTISGKGMCLDGVEKEYVAFIVEVTGRGKYVRAWCCRTKGGCDLFIKGREIKCVNANSARGE